MARPLIRLAILATVFAGFHALSKPHGHMVRDNHTELSLIRQVGAACPLDTDEFSDILVGEILRADLRIKKYDPDYFINATLQCVDIEKSTGNPVFTANLRVAFGGAGDDGYFFEYLSPTYGGNLFIPKDEVQYLKDYIKEEIRDALKDYTNANQG